MPYAGSRRAEQCLGHWLRAEFHLGRINSRYCSPTPLVISVVDGSNRVALPNQRKSKVAAIAPVSCATMKPGASAGRIPAKVSLAARASVTAGLANEVEA